MFNSFKFLLLYFSLTSAFANSSSSQIVSSEDSSVPYVKNYSFFDNSCYTFSDDKDTLRIFENGYLVGFFVNSYKLNLCSFSNGCYEGISVVYHNRVHVFGRSCETK